MPTFPGRGNLGSFGAKGPSLASGQFGGCTEPGRNEMLEIYKAMFRVADLQAFALSSKPCVEASQP